MKKLLLIILSFSTVSAFANFETCIEDASERYGATGKNMAKRNCLETYGDDISFKQCVKVAKSMYGSTSQNSIKRKCLDNYEHSFNQCIDLAKTFYYSPTRNGIKQDCLRDFADKINLRKCEKVARTIYGTNARESEIKRCRELYR